MKVIVFGVGGSWDLYHIYSKKFWDNTEILAFVDNDHKKQGKYYNNIEIISPVNINRYDYDIVLIASEHEEEIQQQLLVELNVDCEKVCLRDDFAEDYIFPWYDAKYHLYDKRILLVGDIREYHTMSSVYDELFNIVAVVPHDNISLVQNYEYDIILLTKLDFLNLINKEAFINQIMKQSRTGAQLLTNEVFEIYRAHGKQITCGNEYREKKFFVIRPGRYRLGLGSVAGKVAKYIVYAKKHDYIPIVDMKSYKNQYLEESEYGKVNAYTKFFNQPAGYDLEDIKNAQDVKISYGSDYIWLSKIDLDNVRIPEMNLDLQKKFNAYIKKFNNKKVLGVLFRGTDYVNLKPYGHSIQPDLDTMIDTVRRKFKEWGSDLIFLCTEEEKACKRFEEEFGKENVCYYPQLRYKSDVNGFLGDFSFGMKEERTERGKGYLVALNCLASCNSLVAGKCGGTNIALKINNNCYENIYLFELGRYGM